MGPDLLAQRASACPRCGAGVRADAPWCTQCFLDLRPAAVPPPPPSPLPPPPPSPLHESPVPAPTAAYDPLTAPLDAVLGVPPVGRTWPCAGCGTSNALALDACEGCGQGFLAGTHAGDVVLRLPGVGDLGAMSRGRRTAVALGAVLALMALLLLVGTVLG